MSARKVHWKRAFKGKLGSKRRGQLAQARSAKKISGVEELSCASVSEIDEVAEPVMRGGGDADYDLEAENDVLPGEYGGPNVHFEGNSASASKLRKWRAHAGGAPVLEADSDRVWCLVEVGQICRLLRSAVCPTCGEQSLEVRLTDKRMGFAREMTLICRAGCQDLATEDTSPRIGDRNNVNVGHEVNRRAVVYTHEVGGGYTVLKSLSAVFGMPGLSESAYYEHEKQVNRAFVETGQAVLQTSADIVKAEYQTLFPVGRPAEEVNDGEVEGDVVIWQEDDNIPSVDVSFDGTWHKRGHTSHHGVGTVIDVLTGYILDYEVLTDYCHACAIHDAKQMPDAERQQWAAEHRATCCKNFEGSAKAMEKEAAVRMWRRSEALHGLRYKSMLGDGDSAAYRAVREAAPYGPQRMVAKYECTNHVHKRFGTALRNASKDLRLGGRGVGRLTKDKCMRLQHYYRGALLHNIGNQEQMRADMWATLFHCTSTDEDPHHDRCPDGPESWCFFRRAAALGEEPGPHAVHCGTYLSREVARELLPIYRRFTSPFLLRKVNQGKTQNANESLHNLIWVCCPKEVFVGVRRLGAAVSEAVARYNRGNFHLAEVMENLNLDPTEATLQLLAREDEQRVKKANHAAEGAFAVRRRARREGRLQALAEREDEEGPVYGQGMIQ